MSDTEDFYRDKLAQFPEIERKRLMYGTWDVVSLSSHEQLLEDAAKEYHDRCDAYDRRVCTAISPRTGEPIPANGSEQGAINANALSVRRDILAQYGITEEELHQAIRKYHRQ